MDQYWVALAKPGISLVVAVVMIGLLIRSGYHRDEEGQLMRKRPASVLILGAATYTFAILALSQLVGGPPLSVLSKDGFGDGRVAWLLIGTVADGIFRIWEEFSSASDANPTE